MGKSASERKEERGEERERDEQPKYESTSHED